MVKVQIIKVQVIKVRGTKIKVGDIKITATMVTRILRIRNRGRDTRNPISLTTRNPNMRISSRTTSSTISRQRQS